MRWLGKGAVLALAVAGVMAAAPGAAGDQQKQYDASGQFIGRTERNGSEFRHYDRNGRFIGRTEVTGNGSRQYDRTGRLIGRTEGPFMPTPLLWMEGMN